MSDLQNDRPGEPGTPEGEPGPTEDDPQVVTTIEGGNVEETVDDQIS